MINPYIFSADNSVLVTFLASFLIWVMVAGLIFLWIIDGKIKKEQVLHALFAWIIAWVIAQIIKDLFPALRPFQTNGHPIFTITVPNTSAFPSTHSAAAVAIAVSVWLHNKRIGNKFLFLAVLVCLGRILGNVHSAFDVLGGGLIGMVSAVIIGKFHLYKLL